MTDTQRTMTENDHALNQLESLVTAMNNGDITDAWEVEFVDGVSSVVERSSKTVLSERQKTKIDELWEKHIGGNAHG